MVRFQDQMYLNNILEAIGNTPLIKINRIAENIPALVLAKVESFNPGNSIKDRIAIKILEDAESKGLIKPGYTIIESTSGNTGMGLALASVIKGYRCIFTTTDKQSQEKIDLLKATGGTVIICPSDVKPDDPKSYYSVARRLSEEIPNAYWCNQYDNPSNSLAHYLSTGPEIWKQTEGKITHLIAGAGTGGTLCGTAKFLKEQNPDIQVWGIDSYGSVYQKYFNESVVDENEVYPYLIEGLGKDFIPQNADFSVVDYIEKVSDKDAAIMTRRLAMEEGLLVGYSSGAAMSGLIQLKDKLKEGDIVVVICPDHGSRYVGKLFNEEWIEEKGFQ